MKPRISILAPFMLLTATAPALSGSFFVNHEAVYRTALAAALKRYPEVSRDDIGLTSDSLHFSCGSRQRWAVADPYTLHIPHQREATTLCSTWIEFIVKSSWRMTANEPTGFGGYCRMQYRYERIHVTVYPDGTADANKSWSEGGTTRKCDKQQPLYEVEDLVDRYRRALRNL